MRCSWFEPHLGRFREGTLAAPKMHRVAQHLEACHLCKTLFDEMNVVEALLVTTKTPPLPPDFTHAVMSGIRTTPMQVTPRFSPWRMLAIYLPLAWVAALLALRIPALHIAFAGSSILAMRDSIVHELEAIISATRAIAPATPLFVVTLIAILAIDIALIGALLAFHRNRHKRISVHSVSERS